MFKKKTIALFILAFALLSAVVFPKQAFNTLAKNTMVDSIESSSAATEFAETANVQRYNCKSALIMDYSTGQVLFTQNPDQRLPIASMTKIMTLILVFDSVANGRLSLEDKITVSPYASSMGGSQAFLDANLQYTADELIKSVIVASANDSCVALAEHLMGSADEFVAKMNEKAKELGLKNSNFVNCTGLPAENQYSCAADAAVMFRELINHEHFFDYSKIWMYDLVHPDGRSTSLTNTNKLVRFYNGCDGGKTGFTTEALSCLAATAKKGDTRLIAVVIAAPSAKERNAEVAKLFNYGFANFETKKVVSEGMELNAEAEVAGGKKDKVSLLPEKSHYHLIKKGEKPQLYYTVNVEKMKAPVSKGDTAGKITVLLNGEAVAEVNLIATEDVKKATYLDIVNKMISKW